MTGGVDSLTRAFFKGLASTGFEEGRNLSVVRRSAAGAFDKLPALAQELAGKKVNAIVAIGGPVPTRAAKSATTTIPIVFAYGGDPVGDGLVASFNRPGGNVTGASFMGASFTSKRLQVLKQLLPQAVDVALMLNPKATLAEGQVRDALKAAPVLGQKVQVMNANGAEEIDAAFAEMNRKKVAALLVGVDPSYGLVFRDRIIGLAARYKLPALYDSRDYVEKGGLISYGSVLTDTWRQAGLYVGRILKGEKPQNLPVVQPTRFETVINLGTARTLGLDVPPNLLALADDTVE
ncbi:MAG: ABC transporter substrate-binding protein [Proteobacteria bacterium]|nr:ABC transporter substrate-binding protein [Pseudomonadota bacterium]